MSPGLLAKGLEVFLEYILESVSGIETGASAQAKKWTETGRQPFCLALCNYVFAAWLVGQRCRVF
jgi:hypothetical protein